MGNDNSPGDLLKYMLWYILSRFYLKYAMPENENYS